MVRIDQKVMLQGPKVFFWRYDMGYVEFLVDYVKGGNTRERVNTNCFLIRYAGILILISITRKSKSIYFISGKYCKHYI